MNKKLMPILAGASLLLLFSLVVLCRGEPTALPSKGILLRYMNTDESFGKAKDPELQNAIVQYWINRTG